ncbi:ribosomal protein L35 [Ammonifex degensii KC4]|uniref:Large ribosomal subunit protein bL35 n=1 Tax=Ammonifex degensii (strain DSM 10501 / KC4) TaxID=429009 RepID=C9RBQ7_AMMDK|nr:50S ribosomal protein L35 [Ammonifex degensii]ACX51684.1 ribosomal protein L35 [Ammonifex degensii KC4]
MPKVKTHRGAAKRFKKTGKGKIVAYCRSGKSHLLEKKTSQRKRRLRHKKVLQPGDAAQIRRLIPYL